MRKKINTLLVVQLLLGILAGSLYYLYNEPLVIYFSIIMLTVFALFSYRHIISQFVKPVEDICQEIHNASDNNQWGTCLDGSCELNLIDSALKSF